MENIQETNNNVLSNYVVTDKADGMRKLLYIGKKGHMYVIDTNMSVSIYWYKKQISITIPL